MSNLPYMHNHELGDTKNQPCQLQYISDVEIQLSFPSPTGLPATPAKITSQLRIPSDLKAICPH